MDYKLFGHKTTTQKYAYTAYTAFQEMLPTFDRISNWGKKH